MKDRANVILVVDDEVEVKRLLQQRFRKKIRDGALSFQFALNGVEALQILQNPDNQIDMVLTDIRMPEMDGLTLLANLAEFEPPLKAVVVSAYGDMKNIRTAMNRGAFDFLTKPIDFNDLEITIDKTLTFVAQLRAQQEQLEEALNKLHNLVFYDQLTGLPNYNSLVKQIAQSLEAKQTQGSEFALLILDIERSSILKSAFGHSLCDRLIVEVAKRLGQGLNSTSILSRIGENVFAVLWHSLNSLDQIQAKVDNLLQLLETPFRLDEIVVSSTAHMGIALSNLPYTQPEAFVQAADTAIQIARRQHSNNLVTFDMRMQEIAIQRFKLEVELQRAIETKQLSLAYQPMFQLDTKKIVGFEALARWQHPTLGQISPLKFIPLAEETGLIVQLGEWVFSEACQQLAQWKVLFGDDHSVFISVNLSSLQLKSPNLLRCIDQSLLEAGLTGEDLRLEITESVLMENIKGAMELLVQLQKRKIKLAIDDFGTGYSSLAYLQLLPIEALKIDSSFIKNIDANQTNLDITSTIIDLAHHLGLEVVAEGLEQERHLDILRSLTCDYGQGYLFSYPLDAAATTALITEHCATKS
jgi:diguanylate cyclase (GGDEF)-like protein